MSRPCQKEHELSPTLCKTCFWFVSDTRKGRYLRRLWSKLDPPVRKLTPRKTVLGTDMSKIRWAWGIMTVPARFNTHLPKTLESLKNGGFDTPHVFVDGWCAWTEAKRFNPASITVRDPQVGVAGNWELSLRELFYRNITAERFVLFQDDLICSKNLKGYLSRWRYPDNGYWNLYTTPSNHVLANGTDGWHLSHQNGRGALGLVFDTSALIALFGCQRLSARPLDVTRGHKAIDGGVLETMKLVGRREYVHSPSLLQHTGKTSTMCKRNVPRDSRTTTPTNPYQWPEDSFADSFRGESFDLLTLIPEEQRNFIRSHE